MLAPAPRLIAHLDMDAFYASVELLRYPELKGRPVVIGGGSRHQPIESIDPTSGERTRTFATLRGYVGRGVITTATYEARAFGLASAMSMMKASALAPDTVLLPVDFDAYRRYSRMFKAAVRAIATRIEDRGIDEIYIDLTGLADGFDAAREIARSLKAAVRDATGLTCSIAVAPNKLLAKIASELDKPDGLTILTTADIPLRVWPLAVRKINGVGPKSSAKLNALGITTIGELAGAELPWLVEHFGAHYGAWLADVAQGRDDRPVVTASEPKSISRETTFDRDLHAKLDRDVLSGIFTELCEGLASDLQRKRYVGKTIGLKLRYDNFKTVTRDLTIAEPTQDAYAIRRAAGECLKRVPLERRIRLLGVRVGSLCPIEAVGMPERGRESEDATPSLFD
jgi:DNA polymerase-4